MIRIAISQAALDAIAATLLLGSVKLEAKTNAKGERLIWLDVRVVDKLSALRRPGATATVLKRPSIGRRRFFARYDASGCPPTCPGRRHRRSLSPRPYRM